MGKNKKNKNKNKPQQNPADNAENEKDVEKQDEQMKQEEEIDTKASSNGSLPDHEDGSVEKDQGEPEEEKKSNEQETTNDGIKILEEVFGKATDVPSESKE